MEKARQHSTVRTAGLRLLCLALIVTAFPARAEGEFNPNEPKAFVENCRPEYLSEAIGEVFGICVGFVEGLVARENVAFREKAYCPLLVPSRIEGLRVLVAYIETHAGEEGSTAFAALKAFGAAYPCGEKR